MSKELLNFSGVTDSLNEMLQTTKTLIAKKEHLNMSSKNEIKAASFHLIQNDLKKRFETLQIQTGKKLWNRIRKDNL